MHINDHLALPELHHAIYCKTHFIGVHETFTFLLVFPDCKSYLQYKLEKKLEITSPLLLANFQPFIEGL